RRAVAGGAARRPWRSGAHGPPSRGWSRWRKRERSPRAVSPPVGLRERARAYEALESPAVGMYFAPVFTGKVDHGETGGRQPLIEALAGLYVAGGDQPPGGVVQPRIVADHEQRAHRRRGPLHQRA